MAMSPNVVFLLVLLAGVGLVDAQTDGAKRPTMEEYKADKAKQAGEAAGEAANEAKMSGVNKVIQMLEDTQQKVVKEGEKEAATYDKFACFCKDNTKEKTKAIREGKDSRQELSATIEKLSKERDDLDKKIGELNTDIEKTENNMKKNKDESDAAQVQYEKNEADLSGAIYGVREATKVVKASNGASLLQLQSLSKTIGTALMLADALGLKSSKSAAIIFLQGAPDVEMEDYKFHSSGIIDTLEKLTAEFVDEKNKVDADETERVQSYNMKKQENTDRLKAFNQELDESKETKDRKIEQIAENSQELTTVSAQLLDDQEFLSKLASGCSDKAKTWDQRSKVRVQELTAITEAMDIIKATVVDATSSATIRFVQMPKALHTPDAVANDEDAMMAIESDAESVEGPVSFLQKRIKKHDGEGDIAKQMIVSLLKNKGMELKSTLLLSLSTQIGGDPFTKIKKLIQELIERLLQEAANEADQKGWCDKAMGDAKQKRDMSSDKVAELNALMAELEATRDKLTEELKTLAVEIKELTEAQGNAGKMRKEEKEENKETVYEAKQGLEATQKAIGILSKFFGTAAKAKIDLSFLDADPFKDAPDAGFKTGEAYTAQGSDSGGIVGMLEVIESDFVRTISETQKNEKAAQQEYQEFMTESSKSLAEKTMATEQKTKYQDEAINKLDEADGNLLTQNKLLVGSIQELMKLQSTCIDTGMSYADRVAMREQEIESLKKALCILGAYAKFGPDGLSDAC